MFWSAISPKDWGRFALPALMRNIPSRKILVNVAPISGEILIKLDLEKIPNLKIQAMNNG
jgi:hypothetical protein